MARNYASLTGRGRIRTFEGIRQRVYSPSPLANSGTRPIFMPRADGTSDCSASLWRKKRSSIARPLASCDPGGIIGKPRHSCQPRATGSEKPPWSRHVLSGHPETPRLPAPRCQAVWTIKSRTPKYTDINSAVNRTKIDIPGNLQPDSQEPASLLFNQTVCTSAKSDTAYASPKNNMA